MTLDCGGPVARSTGHSVTQTGMRLLPCIALFGLAATPAVPRTSAGGADLAAAQQAAFPDGMQIRDGVEVVTFEGSRLVEAPFGPVLVSKGSVADASHGTPGRIAIHYLRRSAGGFAVDRAFPRAAEAGSHGGMEDFSVTRRFTALPAVYAEGGGTWQGYTCSTAVLTELRPEGPVGIAVIPIYYDNQGATDRHRPRSVEGRIANIRRGQSFDVVFTGTERFTEHYAYRDGRFVRTSEESRASC